MINLTTISLSSNRLEAIDETTFVGLYNLIAVYLNDNLLKSIHKNLFKGLPKLTFVKLAKNLFAYERLEIILEKSVRFISFKDDADENNLELVINLVNLIIFFLYEFI